MSAVDARIATRGGTRTNGRGNYDFPGMTDASNWRKTELHRATRYYGCVICGQRFTGPHATYTHLAKRHDR